MPIETTRHADSRAAESLPVLRAVRARRPLIHNITNQVVMNFTANALLAIGASPAMVHAEEEVVGFVGLAQALVVNIGTLTMPALRSMTLAATKARRLAIPWVLDPVGVGATPMRDTAARDLAGLAPAVIRGNAGEIIALARLTGFAGPTARQKGVDSLSGSEEAVEAARALSDTTGAVVAVTGAIDYVVSARTVHGVSGGHPVSQAVTGTGCAATALTGACLAVAPPTEAALAALTAMKLAAGRAAGSASGPASFAISFVDELHALTGDEVTP